MKEPNMEAIAALKPDLIIASVVQLNMSRNSRKLPLLYYSKTDNKDYLGSTKKTSFL